MPDLFRNLTVLSFEQATTLPFLTYRLAQEGMRVVRVEEPKRGDPNRYVGTPLPGEEGMSSYYLPNNLGKKAITLNLRSEEGPSLLRDLITKLPVDIFACNLKPSSYAKLGVDCDTLKALRPELIWLGITGFGPQTDEAAYDPILQARSGFMELTGDAGGTPTVFGLPMVDLCASEHAYGQVMKALYNRASTGEGSRIDVGMFQSAVSFMVNPIMLTESFGEEITRRGNTHQFFAPVSVYPTADGHVYLAVGNDRQWETLVGLPGFTHLEDPAYERNAGRIADVDNLNREIDAVTLGMTTEEALALFRGAHIPAARVNTIPQVAADPLVREGLLRSKDAKSGREVVTAPPVVETEFLSSAGRSLPFAPRLGEHNEEIYGAIGVDAGRLAELRAGGVV